MENELINENSYNKNYDVNEYCNLTLEQIVNLPSNIKLEMLKLYKEYIENNMINRIRKNIITNNLLINNDDSLKVRVRTCINELNKVLNNCLSDKLRYDNTLVAINDEIFNFEFLNTSMYISVGNIISFYPNIREVRAIKKITSDISGSVIYPGSFYIEYKPFFDNITNNKRYVLAKSIKTEIGDRYILPNSLHEFEEWMMNVDKSYSVKKDDDDIDFYSLYCNHGPLKLVCLNKSKKKGRSYSKK